jgi:hypothetical protein
VSLSSVPKQAGECVKKTVTPGVEVQKYLYKPLPLSRDMKQKKCHRCSSLVESTRSSITELLSSAAWSTDSTWIGDRLETGEPYKGLAGAAVSLVLNCIVRN